MNRIAIFCLICLSCSKAPVSDIAPDIPASHKATTLNILPNGGGSGTTDWTGYGTWITRSGKSEVLTDHYLWKGNFMHIESRYQFCIISPQMTADVYREYTLTFKYQSNTSVKIAIIYSPTCTFVPAEIAPAGKPIYATIKFKATRVLAVKWYNNPLKPGYINLDEINLY